MKNYLKLGILFFGISALLWNCENDENTHNHQEHQIAEIKHLDINEIPEVESAISELNNFSSKQNKSTFSKSMNTNFGSLDLSNILEYANNDGKLTYSFLIDKEISLENPYTFENLHLVKLEEGYLAYILKWEPNQDWFENNDYNFLLQYFTGKRTHYDLDYNIIQQTNFINGEPINITSNKSKASKNEHKSMDMEIICVDIIYNLCTDTGKLYCGGSICGFGSKTYCSLVYSGGGGTGGNGSNNSDPDSGNGTSRSGGGSGTRVPRNIVSDSDVVNGGDAIVVPIPSWDSSTYLIDLFNITDPEVKAVFYDVDFSDAFYSFLKREYFSQEALQFATQVVEAKLNGDEVDFPFGIIKHSTFKDSELDCIYEKLKSDPFEQNTFFDDMLDTFDVIESPLTFSIDPTSVADATAFTKGEIINTLSQSTPTFEIISSAGAEAASSLDKMVTLSHELMHAFMYKSLEEWGVIEFTNEGNPKLILSFNDMCQDDDLDEEININTLTIKEKWVFLICEILENSTDPNNNQEWTHSLFESPVFVLETYREKLEQLLLTKHDWDSEPNDMKNLMIQHFGANNWKQKVAEYISWSGLDETPEFTTWQATQSSYTYPLYPTVMDLWKEGVTEWWTKSSNINYISNNCN